MLHCNWLLEPRNQAVGSDWLEIHDSRILAGEKPNVTTLENTNRKTFFSLLVGNSEAFPYLDRVRQWPMVALEVLLWDLRDAQCAPAKYKLPDLNLDEAEGIRGVQHPRIENRGKGRRCERHQRRSMRSAQDVVAISAHRPSTQGHLRRTRVHLSYHLQGMFYTLPTITYMHRIVLYFTFVCTLA